MKVDDVQAAARKHKEDHPTHEFHGVDPYYAPCKNCNTVYERKTYAEVVFAPHELTEEDETKLAALLKRQP